MKAVILAGGEGTRLRPLTLDRPKPMAPLFDRPVLEHLLLLLRRCGVTDIAVTLRYQPQVIRDYFGDGSPWGVSLTYFEETSPLGTAGAVKACASFLDGRDFLVVSGDCVCDFDLRQAVEFHRLREAEATLLLHREPNPLEYGLVLTGQDGRVQRFLEKPGWAQVFTDMANTGLYVLSPKALSLIPRDAAWDFSRDLFPRMLAEERPVYGFAPQGYWCDMGDCGAYLRCMADALEGRVHLEWEGREITPGVWSSSPVPDSALLVPPCWIGRDVSVESGALVGPHTVLGAGSTVGRHAMVQNSALLGASAAEHAALYGAILCPGARAGRSSVLNQGAVLGERAAVGADAILREGVKVWPGLRVAPGARLTASLTSGAGAGRLAFADGGVIRGELGVDLSPEQLLTLGAVLGVEGRVGLGHCGGEGARMLAQAAASGVSSSGGGLLLHDAPTPAAAAWLSWRYGLPVSLFLQQEGEMVYLRFFDRQGLPLGRGRERKLESALLRRDTRQVPASRVGGRDWVPGVASAYAGEAAQAAGVQARLTVSVPQEGPEGAALSAALQRMGCTVVSAAAQGVPAFTSTHGGFVLSAWDEEGRQVPPHRLFLLLCLLELEEGGRVLALPPDAPSAAEELAARYSADVLWLGRDGGQARDCRAAQLFLRDAAFAACRLCGWMARSGERLSALLRRLPESWEERREVALHGDRGALMQALSRAFDEAEAMEDGLRVRMSQGWVWLSPLARRAALRVTAESRDQEIARELCDFFCRRAEELDQTSGR